MVNAYFLDSSALVKRYVPETGSAWIQAIADAATGNLLIIARITWQQRQTYLCDRNPNQPEHQRSAIALTAGGVLLV